VVIDLKAERILILALDKFEGRGKRRPDRPPRAIPILLLSNRRILLNIKAISIRHVFMFSFRWKLGRFLKLGNIYAICYDK